MEINDQWWRKCQSDEDDSASSSDDDDPSFPTCSACGGEYYDDEVLACPHCGHYLVKDSPTVQRFPRWIAWTGIALLLWLLFSEGWINLFINFLFQK